MLYRAVTAGSGATPPNSRLNRSDVFESVDVLHLTRKNAAESLFLPMRPYALQKHPEVMTAVLANLSNELAVATERASASIVAVHARRGIGSSGIVWRDNLIVTSSEGVRVDEGIRLTLPDGSTAVARLRGRDSGTDLAVLETDATGLHPFSSSSDAAPKVGQLALAVGRTSNTGPIASFGIVSGVSREWKTWRGGTVDTFVRLDISVYPTLSGGVAVDASGNLIGLISTGLSRSSVFAIPGVTINRVAEKLIEKGYISHGFLGIALQPVTLPKEIQEKLQQNSGIMLLGIEPEGPAATSGLMLGDVLISAAGQALAGPDALAEFLHKTPAGQTVAFQVLRAGAVSQVNVSIGERPSRRK